MIIENGHISLVTTSGGGITNGIPVPVREIVGKRYPCNIRVVKRDRQGTTIDSKFTQASYEVLIDSVIIPHFETEKVVLTDNRNNSLGQFAVQDVQYLDGVGAIKIVV